MQKILGLDIGSYSVKAIEIENTFKNFRVLSFREVVVPDIPGLDPNDLGMTAVRQLLAETNTEIDKTYAALMGVLASIRLLSLQNVKKRQIAAIVDGELENQAPFLLEDVVVDHQIIDTRGNTTTVLAAMARKDDVEAYLNGLRDLGLEPKNIDVDFVAYLNLLPFLPKTLSDSDDLVSTQLLIDIGHMKTSMLLFHHGKLVAARTIRIAGRYFTEFLIKVLEVSFDEAQRIKHAVGRIDLGEEPLLNHSQEGLVARYLAVPVTELIREVVRTVHAFCVQDGLQPDICYLMGGGANIKGIRETLYRALEIPCHPVEFSDSRLVFDGDTASQASQLSQALAIGLRGVHFRGQSTINLRRGELALAGKYDVVVRQIGNVSLLVGSLLVCLLAGYFLRWHLYGKQIEQLKKDYRAMVQRILETEPKRLQTLARGDWDLDRYSLESVKLINERIREADTAVDHFTTRKTVLPLRILREVSELIPKKYTTEEEGKTIDHDLKIDIVKYTFQGQKVTLDGETDSRSNAEKVKVYLTKSRLLSSLALTHNVKPGAEDVIKFTVEAKINEEEPPQ